MRTDRINFLDLQFDRISFKDLKDRLQAAERRTRYAYIVTPNVDHVVRVHREPELRELYDDADLCVCDSRVLKLLARLRGIRLQLVPGSDLCAALFSEVICPGDRIAIVGADRHCLDKLRSEFPAVEFLHFEAPMGLRTNPDSRRSAAAFVARAQARFALMAVGSPQQEMIAKEVRHYRGAMGIAICIGAGLDFVVGKQKRAPRWSQLLGLEWAHRLLTNPGRLWRRYLVDDMRVFPIWFRWRTTTRHLAWIGVTAALAVACFAIFVYAVVSFKHHPQSTVSWSGPVPSPSQSVAAIKSLPPPNLLKPVSTEEAAKENAARPFADRPDTPASRFILRTDAEDRTRALTCLAQAVYYEAAGEGIDGGRAVAQVVLNRLRHPGFPSTICAVVYEGAERPTGCQFSFTCDGSMERIPVPALWTRSKEIAEDALKGRVFGPVGHATHYHADYVLPYWADSLDKSVQVGRHIFYRLRGSVGDARGFSQRYSGTEPPFRIPGAAVVIPQTPETEQLAKALVGDTAKPTPEEVAKASPPPSPPLLVDSTGSTLLADGGGSAAHAKHREQPRATCDAPAGGKQLSPLRADNLHPSADNSGC